MEWLKIRLIAVAVGLLVTAGWLLLTTMYAGVQFPKPRSQPQEVFINLKPGQPVPRIP